MSSTHSHIYAIRKDMEKAVREMGSGQSELSSEEDKPKSPPPVPEPATEPPPPSSELRVRAVSSMSCLIACPALLWSHSLSHSTLILKPVPLCLPSLSCFVHLTLRLLTKLRATIYLCRIVHRLATLERLGTHDLWTKFLFTVDACRNSEIFKRSHGISQTVCYLLAGVYRKLLLLSNLPEICSSSAVHSLFQPDGGPVSISPEILSSEDERSSAPIIVNQPSVEVKDIPSVKSIVR